MQRRKCSGRSIRHFASITAAALPPLRCYLSRPAALGGKLLFAATTAQWGTELWSTDGTATGTALVADINPNVPRTGYGSLPCDLTTFKDRVFHSGQKYHRPQ